MPLCRPDPLQAGSTAGRIHNRRVIAVQLLAATPPHPRPCSRGRAQPPRERQLGVEIYITQTRGEHGGEKKRISTVDVSEKMRHGLKQAGAARAAGVGAALGALNPARVGQSQAGSGGNAPTRHHGAARAAAHRPADSSAQCCRQTGPGCWFNRWLEVRPRLPLLHVPGCC